MPIAKKLQLQVIPNHLEPNPKKNTLALAPNKEKTTYNSNIVFPTKFSVIL